MSGDELLIMGLIEQAFFWSRRLAKLHFCIIILIIFIHLFLHFYEPKDWGQGHAAILAKKAK